MGLLRHCSLQQNFCMLSPDNGFRGGNGVQKWDCSGIVHCSRIFACCHLKVCKTGHGEICKACIIRLNLGRLLLYIRGRKEVWASLRP